MRFFQLTALSTPLAFGQRNLHIDQVQDLPPTYDLPSNGEIPPWKFPSFDGLTEQESTATGGTVAASAEEATDAVVRGLQPCPNNPSSQGYVAWNEMIDDIEATNSDLRKEPYVLCPNIRFDATGTELEIRHYFTTLSCAGVSCVVIGADIKVGNNLKGIGFNGIDFAVLTSPIYIGEDTHALFSRCTVRDSPFEGAGQAPIVSYGHTFIQTTGFINNIGHGGAILVAEHTLHVDKSAFINNTAQRWADSGSAIQVGETERSMAAVIVTDSCFDANTGANVVLVTRKSYVSLSDGNTLLSAPEDTVFCEGTYSIVNETAGVCQPFEGVGLTCETLFASMAAEAVSSTEGGIPDPDDPSRPFEAPKKDWERNDDDPLAIELGSGTLPSTSVWSASLLTVVAVAVARYY